MATIEKLTWNDITGRDIRDRTILLDIDGVLMADAEDTIHPETRPHIDTLIENNDVWIVSNTLRTERRPKTAAQLGVTWADTPHRKPSTQIMKALPYNDRKPLLVIGDKFFTDGLFAIRIGADAFLLKDRRTHPNDRWYIKLSYILDDFFSGLLKFLYSR
jgi:predicted HAD superfamily phosphohydrolase YqeG